MPELIDKQASMRAICDGCFKSRAVDIELKCRGICNVIDILQQQPTVESEPVRHGEWHECWHTDTVCASICTNCGKAATQARVIVGQELMTNVRYPLCPHCGSRNGTIERTEQTAGNRVGLVFSEHDVTISGEKEHLLEFASKVNDSKFSNVFTDLAFKILMELDDGFREETEA